MSTALAAAGVAGGRGPHGNRLSHGVPIMTERRSRTAVGYAPAGIDEWFRADGTPVAHVDDASASFDLGALIASAEAFSPRAVGPPPQQI
ncbi:hypothetical protein AB0J72_18165 [Dactylosporangium sp. NPDC049742]|uniref:hypothetical protein n=1 Tax=Dactylosporangium sp. NPDC049742 TaxID=3154737 RepID=UPI0034201634